MSSKEKLQIMITTAREMKGLSQRQLAKKVDTHHSTINDIEKGKIKNVNPDLLGKIAEVLDLNVDDVLTAAGYIQIVNMFKKLGDPYKYKTKSELKKLLSDYHESQLDLLEFDTNKRNVISECRGRLTSLELKLNDYETFKSLWTIDKIKQEIKEINEELLVCAEKYDYSKLPRNE